MYSPALAVSGITSRIALGYLQNKRGLTADQQLWADWLAWGLLYLLTRLYFRPRGEDYEKLEDGDSPPGQPTKPSRSSSFTILAFLFVGVQLVVYHTGDTLRWATPLLTATTFATSILSGHSKFPARLFDQEFLQSWHGYVPRSLGPQISKVLPTAVFLTISVASSFAFASRPPTTTTSSLLPGALFLVLATSIYTMLGEQTEAPPAHTINISKTHRSILRPLAIRVFALWTFYLAILAPPTPKLQLLTSLAGMFRLVQLYAMIILTVEGAGLAATSMATSGVAITSSLAARTSASAMTAGLVAVGSLLQTTATLPQSATNRHWVLLLLLLPLLSVLNINGIIHFGPATSLTKTSTYGTFHPIEELVAKGNLQFEEVIGRQSKTLQEAVKEYERRYHRRPPPGFDKWFEMAQANDYLLVDEFDTIMESVEPFWGIPPQVLQARIKAISDFGDIVEFTIRNGTATWEPDHYHVTMLGEWIASHAAAEMLPDMDLRINVLDEPRVIAPYDTVAYAVEKARTHSSLPKATGGEADVNWLSVGQQDSWEAMLTSCPITSPARREYYDDAVNEGGRLPFVANITAGKDVCGSVDMHHQHGFFESPDTLSITHSFVPILSQCAPTIFNDILYPSPYYAHKMVDEKPDDEDDVDWDQKLDRVYWSGTATGGHFRLKNWMRMHRQRLTLMTAPDSTALVSLLRQGTNGIWQAYQSTWKKISGMFNLKITAMAQCEQDACDEMNLRFTSEPDPMSASMDNKYAIDIDGNTFSGRFYRLLKSKSCVLKLTVFREWHDDRLVPWVHYIPVSVGAEELGEMMRFLVHDPKGQIIGKDIADQGRSWATKVLRRTDLEVAFFRVLIEYARLVDINREG